MIDSEFFIGTMFVYALQNWMFYVYLVQIEDTDYYAEKKYDGGYLSKDIRLASAQDKKENPI